MFGPLTPSPAPITSDAVRAVLLDDRMDRGPACMACHDVGCTQCTRPLLPARQPAGVLGALAEDIKPDPLAYGPTGWADEPAAPAMPTPSTFARFLARLRGGTR
jgi:hypothetical protein